MAMRSAWTTVVGIATLVGGIAGSAALALAVLSFYQGRALSSKQIGVYLVARSVVATTTMESSAKGLQIMYNGSFIPTYETLHFVISNVGGQAIRQSDYEHPIQISIGAVLEVLSVREDSSNPPGLSMAPSLIDYHNVELKPELLNPGDSVSLSVGVTPLAGVGPIITVQGHILGVRRVIFRDDTSPLRPLDIQRRASSLQVMKQSLTVLVGLIDILLSIVVARKYGWILSKK